MSAAYEPWSIVENIDVPTQSIPNITHVRVPWAAARTAEDMLKTANVAAFVAVRAVMIAQAVQEQMQGENEELHRLMTAVYEPPLVRFRCDVCEDEWDAWVSNEGHLEDRWTAACTNGQCSRHGMPARLLDE